MAVNIFKKFTWLSIVLIIILGLESVVYYVVHNVSLDDTPDFSTFEKNSVDICSTWREETVKRVLTRVPWWGHACDMKSDWGRIRYNCKNKREMGNWPVCFDDNLVPQNNCLVYSFGINYDFRFDDAMAAIGCTVYSFDPSMLDTDDHKRGDRVFFKRIGISDKDDDRFVPRVDEYVEKRPAVNGWPMRRLQTILDLLGHRKEQLTVLKMDIEGYEWNVTRDLLDSAILSSVPQFLVEWHLFKDFPPRERVPDAVETYFRLNDMGFQLFSTSLPRCRLYSATSLRMLAEVAYLNKKRN
ncbi:uncharacterized protein LOC112553288 isoform X1 [Pomacea canaliculata]|uniref:uncharacterized protein LOC112553288 isoform X1 n=1 Tax=Pomacea canaliculata TaxID=400727 RepID=UPI000D727C9D|nr:uncharacterized protein LOC112553288 isoform X1 [Pomacea canaliculata]XP_025076185.1 uncharacterized protein LOC112553288 isoform X1 [Pomacea canaliculata]XP_025076186.1 uncharacterized protein LOC112553288 isoform X1 [Pomacea canaliculata]XP_025076187.1 uncharacterized protein LOC112553288 isoform X1 [Pomacea canaliculata]